MNRAGKGIVGVGYGSSINPQKKKRIFNIALSFY